MLKKIGLVGVLLVLFWNSAIVRAQQKEVGNQSRAKTITRTRFMPDAPIMIGAVKVGNTPAKFSSTPIEINDPKWIKNLSFKVKNLTHKNIIAVEFSYIFPDTAANGQIVMASQQRLGHAEGCTRDGRKITIGVIKNGEPVSTISLGSFEEMEVHLADDYTVISQFLETREPLSSINQIRVGVTSVAFDARHILVVLRFAAVLLQIRPGASRSANKAAKSRADSFSG